MDAERGGDGRMLSEEWTDAERNRARRRCPDAERGVTGVLPQTYLGAIAGAIRGLEPECRLRSSRRPRRGSKAWLLFRG